MFLNAFGKQCFQLNITKLADIDNCAQYVGTRVGASRIKMQNIYDN